MVDASTPDIAAFTASRQFTALDLGDLLDTRSSAVCIERTRAQVRQDDLDNVAISVFLSRDGRIAQGGDSAAVGPGDIGIVDMSRPFLNSCSGEYRELRIHLTRDVFNAQIGKLDSMAGRNFAAGSPLQALFVGHLQAYVAGLPEMSAVEANIGFEGVLHLLQHALGRHRPDGDIRARTVRDLAEAMIRRRLHDQALDPNEIGKALGVSRTRLYEAFAETEGVAATILNARLDATRRQIQTARTRSIGEIMFACGLTDATMFSRAFRRRFGMTPSEFRKLGDS
ncbi:helix-turn-helix domain-containing protein [Hoeflea marina]|nr:helix-turn-helix domain-containing protein [Hoeflea marina]